MIDGALSDHSTRCPFEQVLFLQLLPLLSASNLYITSRDVHPPVCVDPLPPFLRFIPGKSVSTGHVSQIHFLEVDSHSAGCRSCRLCPMQMVASTLAIYTIIRQAMCFQPVLAFCHVIVERSFLLWKENWPFLLFHYAQGIFLAPPELDSRILTIGRMTAKRSFLIVQASIDIRKLPCLFSLA